MQFGEGGKAFMDHYRIQSDWTIIADYKGCDYFHIKVYDARRKGFITTTGIFDVPATIGSFEPSIRELPSVTVRKRLRLSLQWETRAAPT